MTGTEFKKIRQALGLTQQQLADRMGLSRRETIAEIEGRDAVQGHHAAHLQCIQQIAEMDM